MYFYTFKSDGNLGSITRFLSGGYTHPEATAGGFVYGTTAPLPSSAKFYDAESNSILHMKEVEDNGETFLIIDHDKEPIFL